MTDQKRQPTALEDIRDSLPVVLTLDDAARVLCLSRRTVERMIADGRIHTLPGFGRPRIPRTEIIRVLFGAAQA